MKPVSKDVPFQAVCEDSHEWIFTKFIEKMYRIIQLIDPYLPTAVLSGAVQKQV